MKELAMQLEKILFGQVSCEDKRAVNKWADIDHLVGHIYANRDIFVTWDRDILNKRNQLQEQLGITVKTPEELVVLFCLD